MKPRTRTAAILGIDGSGKTTTIAELQSLFASQEDELFSVTCPRYHDTQDLPWAETSMALQELSDVADRAGRVDGKIAAMFLQMALFGAIEAFVRGQLSPSWLAVERHPLVDTLVFGPLYRAMASGAEASGAAPLTGLLEPLDATGREAILRFHRRENRRLSRELAFDDLPAYIIERTASPDPLADLSRLYRTGLPDAVVFLDVPVEKALARVSSRSAATREQHESHRALTALREGYLKTLTALGAEPGGVPYLIIDLEEDRSPSAICQSVASFLSGIEASPAAQDPSERSVA